jgi:hypothetical protein
VGSATTLWWIWVDRRCARRLLDGRRELCLPTRWSPHRHDHRRQPKAPRSTIIRTAWKWVIAYGALSGGFGALEGPGGVLLMDAAVPASAARRAFTRCG